MACLHSRGSQGLLSALWPSLDSQQQVHVVLMLRVPGMDAALQEGFHKSGVEGENLFPQPGAHTAFGAAQNTVGSLERKKTLCVRAWTI